jgi:hypothetical protein
MSHLSDEQLQQIVDAVSARFMNLPPISQQQGDSEAPNSQIMLDNRWRIEEFRLFEPDMQVDASHPAGDVVTVGRDTIYRNVDAFCQRINDAASLRGMQVIRDNLHLCLRGTASR